MTNSRVPFVDERIVSSRCLDVWSMLVWGAHDLWVSLVFEGWWV